VRQRRSAALTVATTLVLSSLAGALQQHKSGSRSAPPPTGGPSGSVGVTIDLAPKNKLVFPFGIQSFERKENLKVGSSVGEIPGWQSLGTGSMVATHIIENPAGITQVGKPPARWLAVDDFGASATEGFITPVLTAPEPWNYAWTFRINTPVLAIQHASPGTYVDTWGVRLKSNSAELYMENNWGPGSVQELFPYTGTTAVGEWVDVRVVASLARNTLKAFVNGNEVFSLATHPQPWTDVTRLRLSYHGSGAGNPSSILLDEVGIQFLNPLCQDDVTFDFSTEDDFATALSNGQQIDVGQEFGEKMTVSGSGGDGVVVFDTSNPGPNNPSQDTDLLVNQGNALIVQTDAASNPPPVGDIYPRPNDDEDGGTIAFSFPRWVQPLSIDLIDMDNRPVEGATILMTDFFGLTRTYTVPPDWTGDLNLAQPGVGTLDLTTLAPQPGPFSGNATAVEDPGFDGFGVVSISVHIGGSGALDNLHVIIPCVQLTFDTEDDFTPTPGSGTALGNGQDLSTPPEFGVEVSVSDAGANAGLAIFDSNPGGPNDPGPDNDLLVGLGNILILQNDLFATQTVSGTFNTPNDDTNGGTMFFDFSDANGVHCHQLDLIDVDEEEAVGVTVTLLDNLGKVRVFSVPPAWTEDRLNDGPPGFRTLDLETLANQPGFAATATAVEDPGFDEEHVVQMTVFMGGAQDMDNFCFCP
jgi:hypothetical protein